jgi:DnaK suppressor protein
MLLAGIVIQAGRIRFRMDVRTPPRARPMRPNDGSPGDGADHGTSPGRIDRDHLRERLERERARLERRLARETADLATHRRRVSERDPCAILSPAAAAEDVEQEARSARAAEAARQLSAVVQAIRRLEESPDGFGRCSRCGDAISAERLDLLPHATVCERCARAADGM